jgi:hypothetical protein
MGSVKSVLNYLSADKKIEFLTICDNAIVDIGPLANLKCPVLTIPKQAVYSGIKKIALIQNGIRTSDKEFLPKWDKLFDKTKFVLSNISDGTSETVLDFSKKNQIDLFVYPCGTSPTSKTLPLCTLSQLQSPLLFLHPQS